MLNRIFSACYHWLLHIAPLRAGISRLRRVPLFRSMTNSMLAAVTAVHGERTWQKTPIGWMKFEPAWEGILATGEPEPETSPVCAAHLRAESVFYDIGAHVGFYSLMAAPRVKQVFAFEPDPDNYSVIQEVIARNELSNIAAYPAAISDSNGQLTFERSNGLRMSGHIAGVGCDGADSGERLAVPAFTLDEFCRAHPLPTFIKIDVEGAEAAVLRGAARLLREQRPTLLIEVHREEYLAEVESLLSDYNLTRLHRPDLPPFPAHYLGLACAEAFHG